MSIHHWLTPTIAGVSYQTMEEMAELLLPTRRSLVSVNEANIIIMMPLFESKLLNTPVKMNKSIVEKFTKKLGYKQGWGKH